MGKGDLMTPLPNFVGLKSISVKGALDNSAGGKIQFLMK